MNGTNYERRRNTNDNREYLRPYIGQVVTCTGRFVGAKYSRDLNKKGVFLLVRDLKMNDTIDCEHAWFVYTKSIFQNVLFGVDDILSIECKVEEYVDKNGNTKIGFDRVISVKNLTNMNKLYENIPCKLVRVYYENNHKNDVPDNVVDVFPHISLNDELGVSVYEHYTLNFSALDKRADKRGYAWYSLMDVNYNIKTKNIIFNPFYYEHGFLVNDKYFCKINEEAYRMLSTNKFILEYLVRNLEDETFATSFCDNLRNRCKELKKEYHLLSQAI